MERECAFVPSKTKKASDEQRVCNHNSNKPLVNDYLQTILHNVMYNSIDKNLMI